MARSIECTQCGIRYSDALETCPWCGAGDAAPSDQSAPVAAPPQPRTEVEATPHPGPANSPEPAQPPLLFTEEPAPPAAQPHEATPPTADPGATVIASTQPPPDRPASDPAATVPAPRPAARPPAPPAPTHRVTAPEPPAPAPPPTQQPPKPPPPPAPAPPRPAPPGPLAYRMRRIALGTVGVVVLLVIGALIAEFAPLGPLASDGDEAAAPSPTTQSTTTAPATSGPEPTEPPPSTTVAPPTTLPPPPTTLPPIDPVGEPIPVPQLALGVDGMGPLEFGADGAEILGRLVATFGQPDEDSGAIISTGEFGTCPGDQVRIVRFGSLAVVTVVDPATGLDVFRSYRVDLTYQQEPSDTDALTTISGMRAGDTIAAVRDIYAGFDVRTVAGAEGATFELRSGSGTLLLFGPVTGSEDDGVVTGIYSLDPCAG